MGAFAEDEQDAAEAVAGRDEWSSAFGRKDLRRNKWREGVPQFLA